MGNLSRPGSWCTGASAIQQGKILLTCEAVRERERLLRDGGGLVEELAFLLPAHQ
jgi:glycerol-3-phosphate dehydrogenase